MDEMMISLTIKSLQTKFSRRRACRAPPYSLFTFC